MKLKDDYPKWKDTNPSEREISFDVAIELDKTRDIGFYQFVTKQLSIEIPARVTSTLVGESPGTF